MKRIHIILSFFLLILFACNHEEENLLLTDRGTVVDLTGTGNCGIVIELDNGSTIQPLYYPDGFIFAAGQRILVEYEKLEKVITGCTGGIPCEITYIEELSCSPYIDSDSVRVENLAGDPVHLHEAFIDGDCLYIKLSFSGGCQQHTLDLIRVPSAPSEVPTFQVVHNANNDLCEAWLTRELRYDISPLYTAGAKQIKLIAHLMNGEIYENIFDLNQD